MIDKIKNIIIGSIAGIVALIGIYLKGKSAGKSEAENEANKKIIDDIAKIKNRATTDNFNRVRSKYTKK